MAAGCLLVAASVGSAKDPSRATGPVVPSPQIPPPTITAQSAVLIEGGTGDLLFAKNADAKRYPASLTKVLTAVVVLRQGGPSQLVRTGDAVARVGGTRVGLTPGECVTATDLLTAMLVRSGNDAAVALAEHIGGSVADFSRMMNQTAEVLGATHSHFANPHGLHDSSHYSTAYDLAQIMRHGMQWPEIRRLVRQRSAVVASAENHSGTVLVNKNRLLDRYPGATGIKTGYTNAAGRCLAASARRDNREIIAVLLDAEKLWEDAEALLDWGFDNFEAVRLARKGKTSWRVPVLGGRVRELRAVAMEDVVVVAPKGEQNSCSVEPLVPELRAPLERGQVVGRLRVRMFTGAVRYVALVSAERVERSLWARVTARGTALWGLAAVIFGLVGVAFYASAAESARRRRRRLAAQVRRANNGRTR